MVYDPYKTLGVSPDANDDDIKKAYRKLSRKYHPDANINNPNSAAAEEHFKEVQQAYQQIMRQRQSSGSSNEDDFGGFGNFGGFGSFGGFGNSRRANSDTNQSEYDLHMRAAYSFIRSGSYNEALNVLNSISGHTADWHYYSAIANLGLGNNVQALEHAKVSVQMEPNNYQYQQLLNRIESGGEWYTGMGRQYGFPMGNSSDYCCKLCLANIVCNLLCGGSMCCGGGAPRN